MEILNLIGIVKTQAIEIELSLTEYQEIEKRLNLIMARIAQYI